MSKVVVGLSGGVDSSVAAFLLKQQGYDVIGVFMKNWHDGSVTINDDCPWEEDSKDALLVAEKLGIPFHTLDLSEAYYEKIVSYMFAEYEAGRTPNPDVLCNREIKFDLFLKHALKLGADFVATGHYCRKTETMENGKKTYHLLAGLDNNKDQSYFLCQINQQQLSKALFPIGELQKSEVRSIAKKQALVTAEKRDSQGLCFIGKVKLPDFLKQQLKEKEGEVIEIPQNAPLFKQKLSPTEFYHFKPEDGIKVGTHMGAHFYTVGQRKGLHIGGYKNPLFILQVDTHTNTIYVGEGEGHPGLSRTGLKVKQKDMHWVRPDLQLKPGETAKYNLRVRYRQNLFKAKLSANKQGLDIEFEKSHIAVAPGQFAAWYEGDELIGSGMIQ